LVIPNLIVPVLNRYDLLDCMLGSIDYPVYELLIVDNGGELDTIRFNENLINVHIVNLPSNLGVAGSWNLGIKLFPHHDRWFFASNDMVYLPGALESLSEARRDEITISDMFPFWHTFSIGEEVVRKVGLFDEALYPAYFEDNDYERRAVHKNVHIRSVFIPTQHENSSTIGADRGLREKNAVSFQNNAIYYNNKMAKNDYGQGAWSLDRRRRNAWDTPR
jgi:GT2 family glycosyltransferase